ncbi:hypothetical protein M0805_001408 [Coniferiporia weirii]|nr:hypothetical protein M0805_001408 [Coniferiporia weirii]
MVPSPVHQSSGVPSTPEKKKISSSVHDVHAEQPPFGSRFLTADSDVWSKNAWDHVPPPDDQHEKIAASLARQHAKPVPAEARSTYNDKPAKHWDNFYKMNADNFFRNRKWLHTEFPELVAATQPDAGPVTIAELGCGAGNSVFPLLASNRNPLLKLHAHDYSSHAVKLVQQNELYSSPPMGSIQASVWDLTSSDGLPSGIAPSSVDIVVLIFVLSALHPEEWTRAVSNIYKMLKPGGLVVMRDYGRHDLTQLRFKEGRLLEENFYVRGDKTRVYFFDFNELAMLFTGLPAQLKDKNHVESRTIYEDDDDGTIPSETPFSGQHTLVSTVPSSSPSASSPRPSSLSSPPISPQISALTSNFPPDATHNLYESAPVNSAAAHPALHRHLPDCPLHPLFETAQLGVDRRLLVNRKRQLKMYRVWMQGKFRKLPIPSVSTGGRAGEEIFREEIFREEIFREEDTIEGEERGKSKA